MSSNKRPPSPSFTYQGVKRHHKDEESAALVEHLKSVGGQAIAGANIAVVQATLTSLLDEAKEKAATLKKEELKIGVSYQGEDAVTCGDCKRNTVNPEDEYIVNCESCERSVCRECSRECDECREVGCSDCVACCDSCETAELCKDCKSTKSKQCGHCHDGVCSDCLVYVDFKGEYCCTNCRDDVFLTREY